MTPAMDEILIKARRTKIKARRNLSPQLERTC